jgi:uncharacterized protein
MTTKPVILLSGLVENRAAQQDCDCDCACVGAVAAIQDFVVPPDVSLSIPTLHHQSLEGEYGLVFNPENNTSIAVMNQPALAVLESFRSTRTIEHGDDVPLLYRMVKAGLLKYGGDLRSLPSSISPSLSAWLHLTDRCNLRCSYCYLPHIREDMSLKTGQAVVEAVFRSALIHGYRQIKLKYAGGEPLLSFPLILQLHSHAARLAEEHSLPVEEVVLSNGTLLTGDMAKTLKSLDIRLMISMDGKGHYHDRQRPYAGGRGSFQDTARSVDLALAHGLVPTISVTVSGRTAEGLPDIMEWILERGLSFSLNFYRENNLSATYLDLQLDEQKIVDGMRAAFKVIECHLPQNPFLNGLVDRANFSGSHTQACGVGQNYLVFDQNGRVAKCQMHIRQPITNVQASDPLTEIRNDQTGIQNISVEEKAGCKNCEWRHWCAGGCPLETYRATGLYGVRSPNCSIYKTLFPEALRLEGLRLLKYQDDPFGSV